MHETFSCLHRCDSRVWGLRIVIAFGLLASHLLHTVTPQAESLETRTMWRIILQPYTFFSGATEGIPYELIVASPLEVIWNTSLPDDFLATSLAPLIQSRTGVTVDARASQVQRVDTSVFFIYVLATGVDRVTARSVLGLPANAPLPTTDTLTLQKMLFTSLVQKGTWPWQPFHAWIQNTRRVYLAGYGLGAMRVQLMGKCASQTQFCPIWGSVMHPSPYTCTPRAFVTLSIAADIPMAVIDEELCQAAGEDVVGLLPSTLTVESTEMDILLPGAANIAVVSTRPSDRTCMIAWYTRGGTENLPAVNIPAYQGVLNTALAASFPRTLEILTSRSVTTMASTVPASIITVIALAVPEGSAVEEWVTLRITPDTPGAPIGAYVSWWTLPENTEAQVTRRRAHAVFFEFLVNTLHSSTLSGEEVLLDRTRVQLLDASLDNTTGRIDVVIPLIGITLNAKNAGITALTALNLSVVNFGTAAPYATTDVPSILGPFPTSSVTITFVSSSLTAPGTSPVVPPTTSPTVSLPTLLTCMTQPNTNKTTGVVEPNSLAWKDFSIFSIAAQQALIVDLMESFTPTPQSVQIDTRIGLKVSSNTAVIPVTVTFAIPLQSVPEIQDNLNSSPTALHRFLLHVRSTLARADTPIRCTLPDDYRTAATPPSFSQDALPNTPSLPWTSIGSGTATVSLQLTRELTSALPPQSWPNAYAYIQSYFELELDNVFVDPHPAVDPTSYVTTFAGLVERVPMLLQTIPNAEARAMFVMALPSLPRVLVASVEQGMSRFTVQLMVQSENQEIQARVVDELAFIVHSDLYESSATILSGRNQTKFKPSSSGIRAARAPPSPRTFLVLIPVVHTSSTRSGTMLADELQAQLTSFASALPALSFSVATDLSRHSWYYAAPIAPDEIAFSHWAVAADSTNSTAQIEQCTMRIMGTIRSSSEYIQTRRMSFLISNDSNILLNFVSVRATMRGILGTLFPNDSVTVPETVQISLVLPDVDVTSGETGVVYHTLDFIPPVKPLSTELYPLLTNLIRDVPEVASVTDPTIPRSNVFATLTFSEPLLQAPPASTRRVLDAGQYPDAWSTLSTAFGADLTALSGATLSQPGTNENSPASGVSFSVTVSRILFVSGSTVLGLVLSSDAELSETGSRAATLRDTLNRASAPFRGLFPSTVLILQEVLNRLTASDSMSGASTLFPSGTLTWNDVSTVVTTHVTLDLDGIPFESKYGTPSLELMKPFANALAADYHGSLGLPLSQLRMVNFRSDPVTVSSNGSSGESPFTGGSAADSSSLLLGLDVSYVLFESGKEVKGPRWPEGYATFLIFRSWFRTALPDTASVNRSVTQALKVSSKASVDEPLLGGIRFDGFDFYPPEQCTDGCKAIAIVTVMMGTALLVTACAMCAVWKERSIHSK